MRSYDAGVLLVCVACGEFSPFSPANQERTTGNETVCQTCDAIGRRVRCPSGEINHQPSTLPPSSSVEGCPRLRHDQSMQAARHALCFLPRFSLSFGVRLDARRTDFFTASVCHKTCYTHTRTPADVMARHVHHWGRFDDIGRSISIFRLCV